MLYRDQTLGKSGIWTRFAAWLAVRREARQLADLDILAMNAHLRRDIGLDPDSIFRK